ncbi:MAG TPA: pyridoxal phosphate-dependent aminotransferase [Candidatus Pelethousia gallinarum]|nr:pyridoxal phosphate-dependent aminotransferase [Candidatus Pelethousia gallinarum]
MDEPILYVDRKGTHCEKWDGLGERFGREDLLALWVADMDFRVPQCVLEAEKDYLDTGVFGYYHPSEGYYQAFMDWEQERHGYSVQREWLRFSPGVVPAINWLIQIFTEPQDRVLVLTPVYYPFLHAVRDNERTLVACQLVHQDGQYSVDLAAFEAAIAENQVRMFIMSSPHNPVSRVWRREELTAMLDICKKHGVLVLSDEIHQDLTFDGHKHIPSATAGDYSHMVITLTAASKTFNLAGCQNAFVVLPDAKLRKEYDAFTKRIHIREGNPFGYIAVEAAYRGGKAWLQQVQEIIWNNYGYLREQLAIHLPKACVTPLEGTYLMWVDFAAYLQPEEMERFFEETCGIAVDYGAWFEGDGQSHIRINLATSRENVEKAFSSILQGLQAWGRI